MRSQKSRKTTENQETRDPELEGLIQPPELPEYWPHELEADGFPKTKLKFGVGWRVPQLTVTIPILDEKGMVPCRKSKSR